MGFGAVLVGLFGLAAAVAGLAWGRAVPKRDSVGTLCGTCDGLSHVLWDVVPSVAPRACPECGRSVRMPTLVIAATVVICLAALQAAGDGLWLTLANGVLGGSLAALVWIDARYRVLPARVVWMAIGGSSAVLAIAELSSEDPRLLRAGVVAVASGGVFLVLHLISPSGMAFGDVRLAVLLGLHLGWRSTEAAFWGFFLAVLLGAVVGLVWKRLRGTKTLPFGPFLALGTAVVLVVNGFTT